MKHEMKHGLRPAVALVGLLLVSSAFAKTPQPVASNTDDGDAQLFNGWKRSEINHMPQDMFGDTGPVITQTDGISNDPNWMNENE